MKYSAQVVNGVVVNAIVVDSEWASTHEGWVDSDFLVSVNWTYSEHEGFRPPQPYPSWTWENDAWTPPVPLPEDENVYSWSEDKLDWVFTEIPETFLPNIEEL